MTKHLSTAQAVSAVFVLAACSNSLDCPEGSQRIGSTCTTLGFAQDQDSGADASCFGTDDDGDGYAAESGCGAAALDCDDTRGDVHPGASDVCGDLADNDCDGATDEGAEETCNGIDDDCDGTPDEGVAAAFYEDRDLDGIGTGVALYACSAPEATSTVDGDCDDGNPAFSPSVAELCDGLDNDCNASADDTFSCIQNQLTACVTGCGSTGEGICTAQCELPGGSACVAPKETCNFRDDDCDGYVDQDQLANLKDYRWLAIPGPVSKTTGAGSVPRAGGGAWILGEYGKGTGIHAQELDEDGKVLGEVAGFPARTAGTGLFRLAGDGKHVVLAATTNATPYSTRVSVLRANDLSLVAETTLDDAVVFAASLLEDSSGGLHVFVVSSGSGGPIAHVLHLAAAGTWLPRSAPASLGGAAYPDTVVGTRIPCRDEWLTTTYQAPTSESLASILVWRVNSSGQVVGNAPAITLEDYSDVTGIGSQATDCTNDPEILLGYGQEVRTVRVSRSTGTLSLSQASFDLGSGFQWGTFMFWGGRWWAAGTRRTTPYKNVLAELYTGQAPKWLELASGDAPNPGIDSIGAQASHVGCLDLGRKLAVTFNRGQEGSNLDAIYGAQHPADSEMPVAITYLIGCP